MAQVPIDCPYCGTENVGSTALCETKAKDGVWRLFCVCNKCGETAIAKIVFSKGSVREFLDRVSWDQCVQNGMRLIGIFPKPDQVEKIDFLPAAIEEKFEKARADYNAGQKRYEQACMMFRKTLDLATKEMLGKESEGQSLNNRIDMLAARGRLTNDLAQWAHTIQYSGNDFVHESTPTKDEADDMELLTRLFLLYVYTLPAMLEERKKSKEQQKQVA